MRDNPYCPAMAKGQQPSRILERLFRKGIVLPLQLSRESRSIARIRLSARYLLLDHRKISPFHSATQKNLPATFSLCLVCLALYYVDEKEAKITKD